MNDLSDLVAKLKKRGAKTVALQFPEGLKRRAADISSSLRNAGFEVVVSGDPCYGACDLAVDTLEYADVLVHFGHAPVEERPDVICEPWQVDFDVAVLEKVLSVLKAKQIGLVTTVQHVHLVPAMEKFLEAQGIRVHVSEGSGRTPLRGQVPRVQF